MHAEENKGKAKMAGKLTISKPKDCLMPVVLFSMYIKSLKNL